MTAQAQRHEETLPAETPGQGKQQLLGLPGLEVPENNPLTQEKIRLGRQLFFDRRLSHNNTLSCAMCHIPEQGFTSQELAVAIGIEGRTLRRNAPALYNVGFAKLLFHDAREKPVGAAGLDPVADAQ